MVFQIVGSKSFLLTRDLISRGALYFRLFIVVAFLGLLNFFVDHGVILHWPAAAHMVRLDWAIGAFLFALQLVGPFGERLGFARLKARSRIGFLITAIDWASYLTLGIFSVLTIYTFTAEVVNLLFLLMAPEAWLKDFDLYELSILLVMTAGTVVLGVVQILVAPTVKKVEVPLENLPLPFDGFKIVQISDLHVGPTIRRRYVEEVVRMANDLQPDIIALTGDFADGAVADLRAEVASLERLQAPCGVFFVTGNHEYYWDAASWMAEMRRLGARVLANGHEVLKKGDQEIIIAGINDYSAVSWPADNISDPAQALAGAPSGPVKILLAHQPASYRLAQEAGFDLQLSGHTHGGQYFPFSLFIRFFQRYYKGLNRYKNLWIYVSRGTGYWGPPLRAGVPAEITLLTLKRA